MISAIHQADSDASVDVAVTRQQPRALFSGIPEVENVHYLPYWDSGVAAFGLSLMRSARRRKYDMSFLSYPSSRPAYHVVSAAFGARRRFSHRYFENSIRSLQFLESDLVPISPQHNVRRNLELLRSANMQFDEPAGYIVPESWKYKGTADSQRVAFHIGTTTHDGLDSRRWAPERFAQVATRLADEGFKPAFLAGPSEREETSAVVLRDRRFTLFEGGLEDVAQFIGSSALVICNDSGIAHLSAAVSAPVLSLFGPTPLQHSPFGDTSFPFRPSACPPCFDPRMRNTGCALGLDFQCLKSDLTVDGVFDRALALLRGTEMRRAFTYQTHQEA